MNEKEKKAIEYIKELDITRIFYDNPPSDNHVSMGGAIEILLNLIENQEAEIEESHRKENGELRERVKELEEENEDLKNLANNKQWISPCYVAQNYISKSKIKEKIEELDKEYIDILSDYGNIDTDVVINIPNENVRKYCEKLVEKIIVLQELLEKRKKDV